MLVLDEGRAVDSWMHWTWAPDKYFLTTRQGLKYKYTRAGKLEEIEDRNGNRVEFFTEDNKFKQPWRHIFYIQR